MLLFDSNTIIPPSSDMGPYKTILSVVFLWREITSPKLGILVGKYTKMYVNLRCEIMIHTVI